MCIPNRNNNINLWVFFLILAVPLFSLTGLRYMTFREVQCLKKAACGGGDTCIEYFDKNSDARVGFIDVLFTDWDPLRTCWVNGQTLTYINPGMVFQYSAIIYLSIVFTYIVYAIIYNVCQYKEAGRRSCIDGYLSQSSSYSMCAPVILVVILITYIGLMILYCSFSFESRETTCTRYTTSAMYSNDNRYVDGISGLNINGNVENYKLFVATIMADTLPQKCWTNNEYASFTNPAKFIMYSSILAWSIIGFSVTFWYVTQNLNKFISQETATLQYETVSSFEQHEKLQAGRPYDTELAQYEKPEEEPR